MRSFILAVVSFTLVYAAFLAYVFASQNKMVFLNDFAGRELAGTPEDVGLNFEDVNLVTESGVGIHGWFVPHSNPQATLIYFHGNAGNIGGRLHSIRRWHELDTQVMIFDYPGYGQSEGEPSEAGTYESARAVWHFVTQEKNIDPKNIVLFGRSLGGGVAAQLATEISPKALIVESSFTSVPDIASEQFWFLPVRTLSRVHFDTASKLEKVHCPVLIVHSPEDEIIPFSHGERLFEAANEPKQFLKTRGGHNDGHIKAEPGYSRALRRYLAEVGG